MPYLQRGSAKIDETPPGGKDSSDKVQSKMF